VRLHIDGYNTRELHIHACSQSEGSGATTLTGLAPPKYRYSRQYAFCVRAHPCMQGSGDAACFFCMLGAVSFHIRQLVSPVHGS
jgi:hypothetical protein